MKAAAEQRRKVRSQAERTYRKHSTQIHDLIRRLGGPTQADHDQAFDRLARMGEFAAPALLAALTDPTLDPIAAEEVVSLLGGTGDAAARESVWQFLHANLDDPKRASTTALSQAVLGDDRALLYVREGLDADNEEQVANAVASMIMLGQPEDVPHLRQVYRRHRANREIRSGVANAILTIMGETDQHTFNRTMDEIRTSFADRDLWVDIWAILESEFGTTRRPVH